jgi:hypothetical protein
MTPKSTESASGMDLETRWFHVRLSRRSFHLRVGVVMVSGYITTDDQDDRLRAGCALTIWRSLP